MLEKAETLIKEASDIKDFVIKLSEVEVVDGCITLVLPSDDKPQITSRPMREIVKRSGYSWYKGIKDAIENSPNGLTIDELVKEIEPQVLALGVKLQTPIRQMVQSILYKLLGRVGGYYLTKEYVENKGLVYHKKIYETCEKVN